MLPLGLVQMTSTHDVPQNLAVAERLIRQAAEQGAQLIALPESFLYIGPERGKLDWVQDERGPEISRLLALGRELGVWLLLGGYPEPSGHPDRPYNTAALFDARGACRARYRKIHLFDVDIPGGVTLKESTHTTPGDDPVVVETPWGRIGLTICYDLRFPELYRHLAIAGAELILVPSAFTLYTGKDHWRVLLQARAIENGLWVAAPAQVGTHGAGRQSYGRSLVADPWGQVLAQAPDRPCVVRVDLDFETVAQTRARLPSLSHRRLC